MAAPEGNDYAVGNPGGGRPPIYKDEFPKIAEKMCFLGATDMDLADAFGVSERTIRSWKLEHEEFSSALKVGKDIADTAVERSLYRKALGYEFDSEKVFCVEGMVTRVPIREIVPPSDTAIIFWLKNRKQGEWRDRSNVAHTDGDGNPLAITVTMVDREK